MKRLLLSALLALALAVGMPAGIPAVHAQASCQGLSGTALDDCLSNMVDSQSTPDTTTGEQLTAEIKKAADETPSPPPSPTFDTGDVLGKVMTWIASIFAWLLSVAIVTLNYAVYYTVVTMGSYIHGLSAVGVTWRILRDIGNIMLIFGFLAAGLMTILNVEWYGWGTKMLPKLLIAAVFLNFSLFFAEAIIDSGNLFAVQFYTQINNGQVPTPDTLLQHGLADRIMQQLGMQQIYSDVQRDPTVLMHNNPIFIGFMSSILFIVTAFVMFSLAFMLVARFVVLLVLIIVAPVGFAGWAIPRLKGLSDDWWETLLQQTFTAPVLLLLLYVALAVITDSKFLSFGTAPDWLGLFTNTTATIGNYAAILLPFLVAMGLLLVVLMTAKKMSAAGAGWATKTAGNLSFGAAAWGMNRTFGRGAFYAARGLRQSAAFNKFDALTGRATTRTLDRVATGTFDIRGTKALSALPGHIDAGKPAEGGFAGALKRGVETHEKAAKAIEQAHKDAFEQTEAEKAVIARTATAHQAAELDKKTAEEEKKKAQQAKEQAEETAKKGAAELARLEAEVNINSSAEEVQKLAEARKNQVANQEMMTRAAENLANATKNLTTATETETAAKKAKESAEKAPADRMNKAIREGKEAYAEGIDHTFNPIGFVAYGPGTGTAARKIRESFKDKSNKDKLKDLVKKMEKEDAEAEGKPAEEPKKEGGEGGSAGH